MTANPNIIWKPHPGSQELFMTCPIFECLYEGNRGPGKTDGLLMDYAQEVGQGYGEAWKGIIFRKTYKDLEKDLIPKSLKWFNQIFPKANYNESKHFWRWPDGEMLFLSYAARPKDYWNYHGSEFPFIGWEELVNWADPRLYIDMMSCCRSSYPGIPKKYRATTNSYGPGHNWVKMRFINQANPGEIITESTKHPKLGVMTLERVYIHGDRSENTHLLEADPDYEKRLNNIHDPNKRKAWIDGSWDVLSGGMFDDVWCQEIHWLKPFKIPKSWSIYRAFDWGSAKPFSVGWWAESDGTEARLANGKTYHFPPKTLFRIHEWYGWNGEPNTGMRLVNSKIGEGIKEREEKHPELAGRKISKGPADSSIWDDDDGTCIAEKINAGFFGTENKKKIDIFAHANKKPGTRVKRWQVIRDMFFAAKEKDKESPGMYIFNTCHQFKRTIPTLQRDEKNPEDIDTDAEDHIADETGYMVITPRFKSGSIKVLGV